VKLVVVATAGCTKQAWQAKQNLDRIASSMLHMDAEHAGAREASSVWQQQHEDKKGGAVAFEQAGRAGVGQESYACGGETPLDRSQIYQSIESKCTNQGKPSGDAHISRDSKLWQINPQKIQQYRISKGIILCGSNRRRPDSSRPPQIMPHTISTQICAPRVAHGTRHECTGRHVRSGSQISANAITYRQQSCRFGRLPGTITAR